MVELYYIDMEVVMKRNFFVLFLCFIFLGGCSSSNNQVMVNYVQAKEKIINEGAILLDVRTKEEYDEQHINEAFLLPLDEINADSVSKIVDSKDKVIIVYCRSGNRSHQALELLKSLGYNNVYDLGAMSNWKE